MKTPLSTAQHIKTIAGDHGLNRAGDAIVVWLQLALETSSGSGFLEPMLRQRKQVSPKCPVALAGTLAPLVMGGVIQRASGMLDGYMAGFTINAVILIVSGLLGPLLLWPGTERGRLMGEVPQPKFA